MAASRDGDGDSRSFTAQLGLELRKKGEVLTPPGTYTGVEWHSAEDMYRSYELAKILNPKLEEAQYRKIIDRMADNGYHQFVVLLDGRPISMIGVQKLHRPETNTGHFLKIANIATLKEHRGTEGGVSKFLMKSVKKISRERGYQRIEICSDQGNGAATNLYERTGFKSGSRFLVRATLGAEVPKCFADELPEGYEIAEYKTLKEMEQCYELAKTKDQYMSFDDYKRHLENAAVGGYMQYVLLKDGDPVAMLGVQETLLMKTAPKPGSKITETTALIPERVNMKFLLRHALKNQQKKGFGALETCLTPDEDGKPGSKETWMLDAFKECSIGISPVHVWQVDLLKDRHLPRKGDPATPRARL